MRDINKQEPFSINQNKTSKPGISRSSNILTGYISNSLNGGHNKVIAYKPIMAGERHSAYRLKMNIQMLTPLTPAYQNLRATIRAYFVPNSRVWENAEKFTAQKGGTTVTKIEKTPNTNGKTFTTLQDNQNGTTTYETGIYNTALWRDSFISSYYPRMGTFGEISTTVESGQRVMTNIPIIDILPLRGRIAIYNDMERNKEYDPEILEYKTDTVSTAEWRQYMPDPNALTNRLVTLEQYTMRAKRPDSYYTDYRTELQGFETTYPPTGTTSADQALISWMNFEQMYSETKAQAENAQRNDWDIIAELRGSKVLTEGKVQKIAEKTFPINYSAITQNAYNNNEEIREDFRVLGKQGAYSYTDIDLLLYSGIEFVEEGYLHIIMTVSADTVFESGIDRRLLNINWQDQYRPDMINEKNDVLYKIETDTAYKTNGNYLIQKDQVLGFKRKYSEYFKLPNVISGDMTNEDYFDYVATDRLLNVNKYDPAKKIITNNTYQFFEKSIEYQDNYQGGVVKKIWKDYTDLLINKNQAIQNELVAHDKDVVIAGQNQIFFVGLQQCIADMPIDGSIKDNYLKWGEH